MDSFREDMAHSDLLDLTDIEPDTEPDSSPDNLGDRRTIIPTIANHSSDSLSESDKGFKDKRRKLDTEYEELKDSTIEYNMRLDNLPPMMKDLSLDEPIEENTIDIERLPLLLE